MIEIYLGSKLCWNVDQGKINEVSAFQINKQTNKQTKINISCRNESKVCRNAGLV